MKFYKIKNGKIHAIIKQPTEYGNKYLCGQYFISEDVAISGYKVENLVRNLGPECLCKKCFTKLFQNHNLHQIFKVSSDVLPDELFEI